MGKSTGRPPHKPTDYTRENVEVLKAGGFTEPAIARVIGIDEKTLRKHYRAELDEGIDRCNGMVAKTLYEQAMSGNTAALIWWSKSRMGWAQRHELSGPNGAPIPVSRVELVVIDPAALDGSADSTDGDDGAGAEA